MKTNRSNKPMQGRMRCKNHTNKKQNTENQQETASDIPPLVLSPRLHTWTVSRSHRGETSERSEVKQSIIMQMSVSGWWTTDSLVSVGADLQPPGKHAHNIHLLFMSEHHFHLKHFFKQLSQVRGLPPPQNTYFFFFSSLVLDLSERHWGPGGHQEYFKHPTHLPALWPAASFQTPSIHITTTSSTSAVLNFLRPDADLVSVSFQNVFFLSHSLSAAGHVVSWSFVFQRRLHLTDGLIKLQRSFSLN